MSTLIALSPAWSFSIGLLFTFLGIGVLVNILLAVVAVRILSERQENRAIEEQRVTG
jgi:uncharacterized membrane protein